MNNLLIIHHRFLTVINNLLIFDKNVLIVHNMRLAVFVHNMSVHNMSLNVVILIVVGVHNMSLTVVVNTKGFIVSYTMNLIDLHFPDTLGIVDNLPLVFCRLVS